LHGQEIREPFSKALKGTMLSFMLPDGNEADIRLTQLAIADFKLKRRWVHQVQPIHAQDMLSREKTVPSWNTTCEAIYICRFAYGSHTQLLFQHTFPKWFALSKMSAGAHFGKSG
jgi:hypothetical protein